MRTVTTVSVRGGFCGTCYAESIDRVIAGFTIERHDRKGVITVPPLPPGQAVSLRRAAQKYLAERGQGDAGRHPRHCAAGAL